MIECEYYLDGKAGSANSKKGDVCPYFKEGRCDMYDYFAYDEHHCGFTEICSYATKDGKWCFKKD